MFCPQCGTESQSTQYCRVCGANLKVIGKAVALSEAVARSDRGPLPKIKEMIPSYGHSLQDDAALCERVRRETAEVLGLRTA